MTPLFALSARQYLRYYQQQAVEFYHTMTPMEYGMILIGVAFFGYLLMKSSR